MGIGKEARGQTSAVLTGVPGAGDPLVAESGPKSTRRIADQLGISFETLRKWVRQAEIDGGLKLGTTSEQFEELRRLRRETAELRGANEIRSRRRPFSHESSTHVRRDDRLHRKRRGQPFRGRADLPDAGLKPVDVLRGDQEAAVQARS
ncbi:MAG: transposase [Actinobacteria bacterium]|nr:transposase [Actinomycetota bacterium]